MQRRIKIVRSIFDSIHQHNYLSRDSDGPFDEYIDDKYDNDVLLEVDTFHIYKIKYLLIFVYIQKVFHVGQISLESISLKLVKTSQAVLFTQPYLYILD